MEEKPKMNLDDAFNLLVNAARQLKLSYQEHQALEGAAQIVLSELNKKENTEENTEEDSE
jgi:RNA polymerase-interacting CarD/CdnL/TRCF family regulator|tara:strand:- start:7179 stop:7358 length:180 start_codon:yes stop_codon:yes gene_type:complete